MITGASTGIGYYSAEKFIKEGYHVFGSVRSREDADRLSTTLGDGFSPLIFDVTDHKAIKEAAECVEGAVGDEGIACLINNAGIAVTGPNTIIGVEEYRKQFEVNFFGVVDVTKAFLSLLGAKKDCPHPPGKILNISSVSGQLSFPFMGPYSASKHALEGYSHALRRELMLYGVDVVIVAPGSVKTPIWGKAEKIDERILNSDYGHIVRRFIKSFSRQDLEGLEATTLANSIYNIFKSKKPKTRYALVKKKFIKWTMPRYVLSDRMLDAFIKKALKIE